MKYLQKKRKMDITTASPNIYRAYLVRRLSPAPLRVRESTTLSIINGIVSWERSTIESATIPARIEYLYRRTKEVRLFFLFKNSIQLH
jgi:hypothetical protein